MNILLTGAMGFIGSHVAEELLKQNHYVIGFDSLTNPSINPTDRIKENLTPEQWSRFLFYKVDIRQMDTMLTLIANQQIDCIIHLAAIGSVPRSFEIPSNYFDTNVTGFSNILCLASSMGIKRVIYASSSSVYGNITSNVHRTEGCEGKIENPYALTKKINEDFAQMWSKTTEVETIGLRFFNVYGPGQRFDSPYSAVIPNFLTKKLLIKINGDGKNIRDFTYVKDIAQGVAKCIDGKISKPIMNMGTGIGTSIESLSRLCKDEKTEITHERERTYETKCSIASTTNTFFTLGWTAKTKLEDGLRETKEFYNSLKIADNKPMEHHGNR